MALARLDISRMDISRDTLIKASSAVSWPLSCLPEPLFPHLSSERLRKIVSEIHRSCLRFRQASFNQRIPRRESPASFGWT